MSSLVQEPAGRRSSPALSVVVASVNGWSMLGPTLRALDAQPERSRMEVIVVEAVGGETRRALREHRPRVEVIAVDEKRTIPALRHLGVVRARGDLVAILEDHGEVAPDWACALLEAHEGPWGAVGGVVENGRDGLVNWAAFFCEYAPYMGPVLEGESADLPGQQHRLQAAPPAPARPRARARALGVLDQRQDPGRRRADRLDQQGGRPPHQAVPPRPLPGPAVPLRPVLRRDEASRPVARQAADLRLRLARPARPPHAPGGPDRRWPRGGTSAGSPPRSR